MKTIFKILQLIDYRKKHQWLILIFGIFLTAMLESLVAIMILTLIRITENFEAINQYGFIVRIGSILSLKSSKELYFLFSGMLLMIYFSKIAISIMVAYYQSKIPHFLNTEVSTSLMRKYLSEPYEFFLSKNSAELVHNITYGSKVVCSQIIGSLIVIIAESLIIASVLAIMILKAPTATISALFLVGLLMIITLKTTKKIIRRWGKEIHNLNYKIDQNLLQSIGSIKDVKIYHKENVFYKEHFMKQLALAKISHKHEILQQFPKVALEFLFACAMILLVSIFFTVKENENIIPILGLYAYSGFRILPSITRILGSIQSIRYGSSYIDRIFGILKTETTKNMVGNFSKIKFENMIKVKNVTYIYPSSHKPALENISFEIAKGQSFGIVGATGAGKSTLLDILLGLLQPGEGSVAVDDQDLFNNFKSWQASIGYVPQMIYLLDDTLKRNIAFGIPDPEIDVEKVYKSIELAQLQSVVQELPNGIETVIGEQGILLSGGQRQRVSIARALYRNPDVLIFDEATSSLDNQTEKEISDAISELSGIKTVIVIAHRLSTIKNCDQIIYLSRGKLIAQGKFGDLLRSSNEFKELANA